EYDGVRDMALGEKFHEPLACDGIAIPGVCPEQVRRRRFLSVVGHESALCEQVPAGLARGELALHPGFLAPTQHGSRRLLEIRAFLCFDPVPTRPSQWRT